MTIPRLGFVLHCQFGPIRVLEKYVWVAVPPPARIFLAGILFYCIPLALFAKNKYNKKLIIPSRPPDFGSGFYFFLVRFFLVRVLELYFLLTTTFFRRI